MPYNVSAEMEGFTGRIAFNAIGYNPASAFLSWTCVPPSVSATMATIERRFAMSDTVYIYGLVDPETQYLRYVGQTTNPDKRIKKHIYGSGKNSHKNSWIKSLKNRGLTPDMFIIEEATIENWAECEKFWITYFRFVGADLVNHSEGGDGTPLCRLSPETKKKMSESAKKRLENPELRERIRLGQPLLGKPLPPERKEKLSKALKGRKVWNKGKSIPDYQKEFLRQLNTGKSPSTETRKKMQVIAREIHNRPEIVASKSKKITESWNDPDIRKRRIEAIKKSHSREEFKAKRSEISKRNWENPEFREKMRNSRQECFRTEEYRKKRSELTKAYWKRKKGLPDE